MPFAEPMTMLTDYVLAAQCGLLGWRLWLQGSAERQRSMRLLAGALTSTAVGAASGGTAHGFAPFLSDSLLRALWKLSVYSIGVTAFLFLAAATLASLAGTARRVVLGAALAQLIVYAFWMRGHDDFVYVLLDYVPAMAVVLLLQIVDLRARRPSAPWIIAGIVVSFIGAGVQASGLTLHRHFNHNDIYHVIQMLGIWLLYRGGSRLRDRERRESS